MKSLIRKAMLAWCLYGIVKLCIFVNPWLLWVGRKAIPGLSGGSIAEQTAWTWFFAVLAVLVGVVVISIGHCIIRAFSDWLFGK